MNNKEIIKQMANIVESEVVDDSLLDEKELDWIEGLPQCDNNCFYMYVVYNQSKVAVCIRELTWVELNAIEIASYRKNKTTYYSGEYERRRILSKAIKWIADITSKEIQYNNNDMLSKISDELAGMIWNKYLPYVRLTAKEADDIYEAALVYYGAKENPDVVFPAVVIEVDMLIQLGKLSLQEIRDIKCTEMERIKLVLKARSEALRFIEEPEKKADTSKSIFNSTEDLLNQYPKELFPPGFKSM